MARERKPYQGIKGLLPPLEGYITFGEAAADLDITTEGVRQMAVDGRLKTARTLGRRPIGVVEEAEIQRLVISRRERAERQEQAVGSA